LSLQLIIDLRVTKPASTADLVFEGILIENSKRIGVLSERIVLIQPHERRVQT
jgi:hypothetical protein